MPSTDQTEPIEHIEIDEQQPEQEDAQPARKTSWYRQQRAALIERFDNPHWVYVLLLPLDFLVLIANVFFHREISMWVKLELVLALMYFAVPNDLIPRYLPGIGLIDDVLIFLTVGYNLFTVLKTKHQRDIGDVWPGEMSTFNTLDNFMSGFHVWSQRLIILMAIYRLGTILFDR